MRIGFHDLMTPELFMHGCSILCDRLIDLRIERFRNVNLYLTPINEDGKDIIIWDGNVKINELHVSELIVRNNAPGLIQPQKTTVTTTSKGTFFMPTLH